MKNILIIGATSAIASATGRIWASQGESFYLVGRNKTKLSAIRDEFHKLGAHEITTHVSDLADTTQHKNVITQAFTTFDEIDIVLIAYGTLADQRVSEVDFSLAFEQLHTNAISTMSLLTYIAQYFEQQKHGTIAAISSVAGDRGRQSNYVYGTAKGALTIFLEGLRHRLHKCNVNVLTIKPGLVDTPMTKDFQKSFLWTTDHKIAKDIVKGIRKKKAEIYTPWFWKFIMLILTHLPRSIYNRTNL
jgi:hypothetical protein